MRKATSASITQRWKAVASNWAGLSRSTPSKSGAVGGVWVPRSRSCAALEAPAFRASARDARQSLSDASPVLDGGRTELVGDLREWSALGPRVLEEGGGGLYLRVGQCRRHNERIPRTVESPARWGFRSWACGGSGSSARCRCSTCDSTPALPLPSSCASQRTDARIVSSLPPPLPGHRPRYRRMVRPWLHAVNHTYRAGATSWASSESGRSGHERDTHLLAQLDEGRQH